MHAAFFAYESAEKAIAGNRKASERYLSLNGTWKFLWVRDACDRPDTFFVLISMIKLGKQCRYLECGS